MERKPKVNSEGQKELEKVEEQFNAFDQNLKDLTQDNMNKAPKQELEPLAKLSQKDIEKSKDLYLKPNKTISCADKFNEKWREDWNFAKEYVHFIAEHREVIGENIEVWTKKFPGVPAEYWIVPTGKPIWGPRYLAEQIKGAKYHRLVMKQDVKVADNGWSQMYGALAAQETIQRLDALPVTTNSRKSIFMGAVNF